MSAGSILLVTALVLPTMYGEDNARPQPPAVCDGPICLADVHWFNQVSDHYLAGQNIDAVLVNRSPTRLSGITVTFHVRLEDGVAIAVKTTLPWPLLAGGSRVLGVALPSRRGVMTEFATVQCTATQRDGSSMPVSAELRFPPIWNPLVSRVRWQSDAARRP